MSRRFSALAAVSLAALAGACDQSTTAGPQVDGQSAVRRPPTSATACLFTGNPSLSSSANSYFTVTADRRTASDLIGAMQTARDGENTADLRQAGFALLTLLGQVSRGNSPGDPAVGALLTKQDFNCMFDTAGDDQAGFEGWPDAAHYDFAAALTPDDGGAFYVRGGAGDPQTAPVIGSLDALNTLADPAGGNVSALAPPAAPEVKDTWTEVLGQQVLFFGNTVTDGYDWKVLPRNATFSPFARVALCQGVNGGGQEYSDADMVNQFGVGVLGFVETGSLCGTPPPVASLLGRGAYGVLARLTRTAAEVLSPAPLYASFTAAVVRGGSVSGAKGDEFTFRNLPAVSLAISATGLQGKNTVKVGTGRISVTVVVTTPPPASDPVGGINVSLSTTDNNGTGTGIFEVIDPAYLGCDPASGKVVTPVKKTLQTIDLDGTTAVTKVEWNGTLCFSKTGAVSVVATSQAAGNPASGNGTSKLANQISVKP